MTTLSLHVVGVGLVSPAGRTTRDHTAFIEAGTSLGHTGGLVDALGEPVDVAYCPWLGAGLSARARALALASGALAEALRPMAGERLPAIFVPPAPGAGWAEPDTHAVGDELSRLHALAIGQIFPGAAGWFDALSLAESWLTGHGVAAVALVTVDSLATPAAFTERAPPRLPWLRAGPPPSEGAAALVVTTKEIAQARALPVLARLLYAASRRGSSSDDDDEIVDGVAMTELLRQATPPLPFAHSYGPHNVDALRHLSWTYAASRTHDSFLPLYQQRCVEDDVGVVGDAAGGVHLAYAIASLLHGTAPRPEGLTDGAFVAWAIARDGTRGLCVGTAAAAPSLPAAGPLAPAETAPTTGEAEGDELDDEPIALFPAPGSAAAGVAGPTIDPRRAAAISPAAFYQGVVSDCLDRIAALARQREVVPLRDKPEAERRMQTQLDAVTAAPDGLEAVCAYHAEAAVTVWERWAVLFALASLPDGQPRVVEIAASLEPADAPVVSEALAAARGLDAETTARDLMVTGHHGAQAVAIELLSLRERIATQDLLGWLGAGEPATQRAAIRGLLRRPDVRTAPPGIDALVSSRVPALAAEASRAVTAWGSDAILDRLRGGDADFPVQSALEVLVMRGRAADIAVLERIVGATRIDGAVLDAIARFGNPMAYDYLLHFLIDPELGGAARDALHTLFGPLVAGDEAAQPEPWRQAIGAARLDPDARYRGGQRWQPSVVAAECATGALPLAAVERRIDELRARAGASAVARLRAWGQIDLTALAAEGATLSTGWPAGGWL